MLSKKMTFLFPFFSLLLFLMLTFLRCSDGSKDPTAPGGDKSEGLIVTSSQDHENPGESLPLSTRPGEFLTVGDVMIHELNWKSEGDAEIRVEIPDSTSYVFDFLPDGKRFSRPIRIDVSLEKADLSDFYRREISVWCLSGEIPRLVPSVTDFSRNTVSFQIEQLARYALAGGRHVSVR